ncbi:MAG: tRNA (adenosine(37)-N6)-threonylcarbamoyltransferase complex transferase subunit TsaD [Spirochaetae bacterium HGW-Spirochaetae-1]|jgi:N6-L-threonylcarbamoyladenine synthase|nr:MAG: tRNA (adenosine(37)-N6)-threonylcarbamoyltransferase complex transferase subunit TsaD [Spirochaetae bacterium HGW-Spirochaetae-1]
MHGDVIGLGLESSCDETAAAIVINGSRVLANHIFSQIDLHKEYFGVVPEIASRSHLEVINGLIESALDDAGISFNDLSYVAATSRPGLVGSLLIGLQSAKAIAFAMKIPLIAVNHLEAHLYAPFLEGNGLTFPYIGLLISGGNTALYRVTGIGAMEIIGKTVDDAVGEAFDKVAKHLGLEYPGGPVIEKLAVKAVRREVLFPKILTDPGDMRFSYSGIKTAVVNYIRENPGAEKAEIVYSFQERALEVLVRRVFAAARKYRINDIVVAGGVAANGRLRQLLDEGKKGREKIIIASPKLCTDNAAMVAGLAFHYFSRGEHNDLTVDVNARAW